MIAALSGWGGGEDRARVHDPDTLGLLRWSEVTFAARLSLDGIVADANPALERALGGALTGVPATDLVADGQRPVFARLVAAAATEPQTAVLTFAADAASDRRVVLRRDGDTILLAAEPAVREEAQLAERMLGLNDDLVDARRRLERRTQELEQARSALESANERLRYLESIGAVALTHDDLDGVLDELLQLMLGALEAERGAIWLLDEDRDQLVAAAVAGPGGEPAPGARTRVGEGDVGTVARSRVPLVSASFAGVPLIVGRRLVGVAHVCIGHAEDQELALLRLIADRAALAILRLRDLERHRRIGATLQQMLLPGRLPDVPGLALAARYLPGSGDAEVGGDWFDAIALTGGRLGIAIGDVAGRGLQAATTMGQLRHAMRAYAREHASPTAVLHRLDGLTAELGTLATACYAVIDERTGEGVLASSGHLPPLVLDNGASHFLDGVLGAPLGVGGDPGGERAFTLPPGGGLLLYTDGLVETRGEIIDAGLARLREAASGPRDEHPRALCDRLVVAMGRDVAHDDVALLACRRVG